MTWIILLDTGPLGMVTHPRAESVNERAANWLKNLLVAGVDVRIPEIADYELRRELLRAGKSRSISVLDRYKTSLGYEPLTTDAMRKAAEFWATARRQGKPTAPDLALDADVILAAQAANLEAGSGTDVKVILATSNEGHLSRFVAADYWERIQP